jgi:hypothetical protein
VANAGDAAAAIVAAKAAAEMRFKNLIKSNLLRSGRKQLRCRMRKRCLGNALAPRRAAPPRSLSKSVTVNAGEHRKSLASID